LYLNYSRFAGGAAWLSASDIDRKPGEFFFSDGTPVDSTTWAFRNPNYFKENQKTCVVFDKKDDKFRDWACAANYFTLCELPEELRVCMI
jgi:hypothetical protein